MALGKTTGLIAAVLPDGISTLAKASVSILFEAASNTLPVVAVIEAVVIARRNLITAAERLPVPVSIGWIRRRRLVEAVSSEAYAN
jgi:hypothetical protein